MQEMQWSCYLKERVNSSQHVIPLTSSIARCLHLPPYFPARAIRLCHLNFSPVNPRCHGNEFWDKIHYNSVCVKDICKIFCVYRGFSRTGHRMMPREFFPERPSLPWQQNLGHNGLELGLRKRYIEDLCIRWGVLKVGLFWYGQCAIIQKRTNRTLSIRKIAII